MIFLYYGLFGIIFLTVIRLLGKEKAGLGTLLLGVIVWPFILIVLAGVFLEKIVRVLDNHEI